MASDDLESSGLWEGFGLSSRAWDGVDMFEVKEKTMNKHIYV